MSRIITSEKTPSNPETSMLGFKANLSMDIGVQGNIYPAWEDPTKFFIGGPLLYIEAAWNQMEDSEKLFTCILVCMLLTFVKGIGI